MKDNNILIHTYFSAKFVNTNDVIVIYKRLKKNLVHLYSQIMKYINGCNILFQF